MSAEHVIYLVVLLLWLLAFVHGALDLRHGWKFYRRVVEDRDRARALRDAGGRFLYQPKAAVILPCCGVDDKLEQTVRAVGEQDYDDYHVIFTFEDKSDPAWAAVEGWTRSWSRPPHRFVQAGPAEGRSQKVHNLLAALSAVAEDRQVFIFLDSDAVPARDWLGHLVAPLSESGVGVTTGYRWYTATGGLAAGARSAWNAATLTLLDNERLNFCWGGATAILRTTFDALRIAQAWQGSLTDDYPIALAAREAGLRIRFVPHALVPSADQTTFRGFWQFARRQLIITRVYIPRLWRSGLLLCLNFVMGGTAVAALFVASLFGWLGSATVSVAALLGWIGILLLAISKAWLRQLAVRRLLRPPDWTWRDFCWDVAGVTFSGLLHLALLVSSASSRRFVWRDKAYELISPTQTRLIGRIGEPGRT